MVGNLRSLCFQDVACIRIGENPVTELLGDHEYYELPTTRRLISLCRKDIVTTRLKLCANRALSDTQRSELWRLVDSREWFIRMVAKDYQEELEQIDRELESELTIKSSAINSSAVSRLFPFNFDSP